MINLNQMFKLVLLIVLQVTLPISFEVNYAYANDTSEELQTQLDHRKSVMVDSKALHQQRELLIRLPKDYENNNLASPVIYVLNANDFFSGNIFEQTVSLINRLETLNDIPPTIVVAIQSHQWYSDVILTPLPFETYISREVPAFIEKNFRTLSNKVLVGHSYAGAFVSNAIPFKQRSFDLFLALSPIYPNSEFIENTLQRYSNLAPISAKLQIIDGDESPVDKQALRYSAKTLPENTLDLDYYSLRLEGHMSVFTIGLNQAIRTHFIDYRAPSRQDVINTPFDLPTLKAYYQTRDTKYGTKTTQETLKKVAINIAHKYSSMNRVEQALPFWRYGQSKFKEYFMFGHAERYDRMGEKELAKTIWKEMAVLFPESKKNYSGLLDKYNENE
jgi:predicted alpha/beta superfamily hydrolase